MALFNATFATDEDFNVRAVQAGDAAEMVSRLTNELVAAAAAGETNIVDFNLAGAGSGPLWQGWVTTAADVAVGGVTAPVASSLFAAAVAGNPAEALFYLKQRLAALNPQTVYKVEVAGAGDGPTYMAVALCAPGLI